jgi:putative transposase
VKHGCIERAVDWQYSSIHKFISTGILNENWGTDVNRETMDSFDEMSFNPM